MSLGKRGTIMLTPNRSCRPEEGEKDRRGRRRRREKRRRGYACQYAIVQSYTFIQGRSARGAYHEPNEVDDINPPCPLFLAQLLRVPLALVFLQPNLVLLHRNIIFSGESQVPPFQPTCSHLFEFFFIIINKLAYLLTIRSKTI